LSTLDKEPLFIGISVSTLGKAFRMVDIGPNAESKEEVYSSFTPTFSFCFQISVAIHAIQPSPMI